MTNQQQPTRPSDGSRSRTGCITCRIRKKKCDEHRPECYTCWSRGLACYGFHVPAPTWFTSKTSWKDVRDCDEAKQIRTFADTRYKLSRRFGSNVATSTNDPEKDGRNGPRSFRCLQLSIRPTSDDIRIIPPVAVMQAAANIWQLRPETVWWDSKLRDLTPNRSSSTIDETRLLMIFMDVIHPITHTFDRLDSGKDRSWMLERLVSRQALYCSALSVSACFETSLTQSPSINDIGICSRVRRLQGRAIRELQAQLDEFVSMKTLPIDEFVWAGIQLLDVVSHLETLEIFSMLQGHWEMHHQAARKILNHIEICARTEHQTPESSVSTIEATLSSLPVSDLRRRSLEFSLCNFIWIDVLATSTFGAFSYSPCAFEYLELLQSGLIKPQKIMGCQGWIMATITKIARLEQWKVTHQEQRHAVDISAQLARQRKQLNDELQAGIDRLESEPECMHARDLEEDIRLLSIIWGYAAQLLLQVTVSDMEEDSANTSQTLVNTCLQKLEHLPTRLVMRASWPYTIAGSLAASEEQHTRFRRIVGRTLEEAQPPGISWKGLMVMEECWRLRRVRGGKLIGWRDGMKSLGARVLLT
ncbi:hypothetical protein K491DRAFT_716868 [Lophiostoma macrostomum CBS 122681]|uniref:Zn(2)-C6 fungal-type domain-containing protein n=1 Tax=Lophiostoma macrostomum CBS 122681 TaxID=1314788 RepID=A0A6A6T627_9PLEO|nr:hypothetical protein K491DRAFT_716868 [Lophiostoma macrostomum CBS 122681]